MAEYINKQDVMNMFYPRPTNIHFVKPLSALIREKIETIPAADVRPVVLCRDCKMASPCSDDREMYCTLNHCYKATNYFCADGRKKNENPN